MFRAIYIYTALLFCFCVNTLFASSRVGEHDAAPGKSLVLAAGGWGSGSGFLTPGAGYGFLTPGAGSAATKEADGAFAGMFSLRAALPSSDAGEHLSARQTVAPDHDIDMMSASATSGFSPCAALPSSDAGEHLRSRKETFLKRLPLLAIPKHKSRLLFLGKLEGSERPSTDVSLELAKRAVAARKERLEGLTAGGLPGVEEMHKSYFPLLPEGWIEHFINALGEAGNRVII